MTKILQNNLLNSDFMYKNFFSFELLPFSIICYRCCQGDDKVVNLLTAVLLQLK